MDGLQAKAMADLSLGSEVSEDQFYDQHSFERFHHICACLRRLLRSKPLLRPAPRAQVMEP